VAGDTWDFASIGRLSAGTKGRAMASINPTAESTGSLRLRPSRGDARTPLVPDPEPELTLVVPRASTIGKRAMDVVVAGVALLVLSPVMLDIALSIALSSPGPVLFRHGRVGRHGRSFSCLKFRTMVQGAEGLLNDLLEQDPELASEFQRDFKLREDPRITRIGGFLRRTSLDELPQLWNVLRGEMSVVGPRPVVEEELDRYGYVRSIVFQARPGITGAWQVSGRNDLDYDERVALDLAYVIGRSILLDLRIMARTVVVMLTTRHNGAY
jgi:lipopolysaccharide/colanic/teichoic acid biosynthesis glycosyltransferase